MREFQELKERTVSCSESGKELSIGRVFMEGILCQLAHKYIIIYSIYIVLKGKKGS